jgi:hypothetical protein
MHNNWAGDDRLRQQGPWQNVAPQVEENSSALCVSSWRDVVCSCWLSQSSAHRIPVRCLDSLLPA